MIVGGVVVVRVRSVRVTRVIMTGVILADGGCMAVAAARRDAVLTFDLHGRMGDVERLSQQGLHAPQRHLRIAAFRDPNMQRREASSAGKLPDVQVMDVDNAGLAV